MKKLKLNLDEIKVESFEASSTNSKLGTILGHQKEGYTEVTCDGCGGGGGNPTYETYCGTCPAGTCAYTCGNTWCTYCVTEGTCPTMEATCYASCYTKCMC